jgi:hypothetical protein
MEQWYIQKMKYSALKENELLSDEMRYKGLQCVL